MTSPTFVAPDAGPWELDVSHFDRPFARYGRDIYERGFAEGQARWFERVGVPLRTMRVGFVQGLCYVQMVPLVGPSKPSAKLPPRWLFRALSVLHPKLRERRARARRWLAERGWRDDVRRWDHDLKPALLRRLAALEAEDLEACTDEDVVAHVERLRAVSLDSWRAHFEMNGACMYPVAKLLAVTRELCGASPADVLAAIRDSAESAGGDDALGALVDRLDASGEREALLGGDASDVIERLRARADAVGEAARGWLARVESRMITAGDLSRPIGAECPELLVEHLRASTVHRTRTRVGGEAAARLRERIPASGRARFDDLLVEARLVHRVRDERSTQLDCWSLGLMRRGVLAAGRRLVSRGLLAEAAHVVDLEHDELVGLLLEGKGPKREAVAERTKERCSLRVDDAPELLGTSSRPPPPPLDYFDDATADLIGAVTRYGALMEGYDRPPSAPASPATVRGFAASAGRYRGPVRIALAPEHFAAVRPGDVLVARATMPAYDVLLPIVGAVVTERGGVLSHAAIVAREYGLPCVVGVRDATSKLRDGMLIEVDGDAGTVTTVG